MSLEQLIADLEALDPERLSLPGFWAERSAKRCCPFLALAIRAGHPGAETYLRFGDVQLARDAITRTLEIYGVGRKLGQLAMEAYDKAETQREGLEAMIRVLKETVL